MTTRTKKTLGTWSAKKKPRGVTRRPASRVAKPAKAKTPRVAAKTPKRKVVRAARKANPSPRFLVVTGPEKGFANQAEAVAYGQRFADKYGVSLHVVQK
jgi:hypothetical protein